MKKRSVKVEVSEPLWYRLHYYAKTTDMSPELAVEHLLERHLPDLAGGFALFLEKLESSEQTTLKRSFYTISYLVSYADEDASYREAQEIEKQVQLLGDIFGEAFVKELSLSKSEQKKLLEDVKAYAHEDVIATLLEILRVFEKMSVNLREEYKDALLDSMFMVASASRDSIFSMQKVSEEELSVIRLITYILDMRIPERYREYLDTDFHILLETRHKAKVAAEYLKLHKEKS